MYRYAPSTPRSNASGYSIVELLFSTVLTMMALAATSSFFLAGRSTIRNEDVSLETTQAIRSTTDLLLRDLRLGGACLPVTGHFVALEGINNGTTDTIINRTGVTRSDLSCVRSATTAAVNSGETRVTVENVDGFAAGTRAYIRHPDGSGEFFTVGSIDSTAKSINNQTAFTTTYPATSGVYGIDERRYAIDLSADPPVLTVQVNNESPQPYAIGIEKIDIQYQLKRNCPQCDVVDLPATSTEWALVDQVLLTITARSARPAQTGEIYRKSATMRVKPRNLLPQ